MKSRYHFLVSLFFSIITFLQGSALSAFLCMFVGWLIDVDHEIDHFIFTRSFVINPLKMGNELGHRIGDKMYLPLHGWEILFLIIVGCLQLHLSFLVVAAYFCHLIMDIIGNNISPLNMSILRRWSKGWKRE